MDTVPIAPMAISNYPAPRAPEYEEPTTVEQCLPEARKIVQQERSRASLGPVKDGSKILIITPPDQNSYIQDAISQALAEEGAETVDFLQIDQLTKGKITKHSAEDGWREAVMFENEDILSTEIKIGDSDHSIVEELSEYIKENPKYDSIYYDVRYISDAFDALGDRYKGNWLFDSWEEFVSGAWSFPDELIDHIGEKIIEPLDKASAVRITDPEGTHLEFSLTKIEAERWKRGALYREHPMLNPRQATSNRERTPIIPKVNGVLAGTSNLTGFFPHIELYFENGRVVDVEGGGRYGDKIEELIEKYRDIQWPGFPQKGLFWLVDVTLWSSPKAFRRQNLFDTYCRYPNITEGHRSGVLHIGFGTGGMTHTEEMFEYAEENDIPLGHLHVQNYFSTFEVKIRGTNTWHKIVDKGRTTALDDPEIKAHAAEYGNPDRILSYDWVPPLPGINCDGNYATDYASSPSDYLKERLKSGNPI